MKQDLVSAIITTKNRIHLLKRAVESVFNQSYKNIELVVVDDGSTDETSNWCLDDNRIKYIRIPAEESKGGNYARNQGIRNSNGKYIAFLDDDDYWLPEKIEKQVELAQNKNCDVVYGGRILESISGDSVVYKNALPDKTSRGDMSKKILLKTCTTTTTILVTRNLLDKIGLFDEQVKFWQEYELCIRLAQESEFEFVNEPIAVYRIDNKDPNKLTNKFYGWLDSVKYIKTKHAKLYDSLTPTQFHKSLGFQYREAFWRAKTCGMKAVALKYLLLAVINDPINTISKSIKILTGKYRTN